MDSTGVNDDTIESLSSDTGNIVLKDTTELTARRELDDRLSLPVDNSESISSENKTEFIGSIFNQEYTNVFSPCSVSDIPLPPGDYKNPLDKNTEVLQSSLIEYNKELQTSQDEKMDDDEEHSKTNDDVVIISKANVSSVKDDCLPLETDLTKSDMETFQLGTDVEREHQNFNMEQPKIVSGVEREKQSEHYSMNIEDVERNLERLHSGLDFIFQKPLPYKIVSEGSQSVPTVSASDEESNDGSRVETKETKTQNQDVILQETSEPVELEGPKEEELNRDVLVKETPTGVATESEKQEEEELSDDVTETPKEVLPLEEGLNELSVEETKDDDMQIIRDDEETTPKEVQEPHDTVEEIKDNAQQSPEVVGEKAPKDIPTVDDTREITDDDEEEAKQDDVEEIKHDIAEEVKHDVERGDDDVQMIKDDGMGKLREEEQIKDNDVKVITADDVTEINDDDEESMSDNDVEEIKNDVEKVTDEEVKDADVVKMRDDDIEEMKYDDTEKFCDADGEGIKDDGSEKLRDDMKETKDDNVEMIRNDDVEEIKDDDVEEISDDVEEIQDDGTEELRDDMKETKDDNVEMMLIDDVEEVKDDAVEKTSDDVKKQKDDDAAEKMSDDDDVEEIKDDVTEKKKNDMKETKDDQAEIIIDDDVEEIKDDDVEEIKDDDVEKMSDDDVEEIKDDVEKITDEEMKEDDAAEKISNNANDDVEEIIDDDTEKIRDDVKETKGDHGDVEEIMDDGTEKIRDDVKETNGDHGDVEEIMDDDTEKIRDDVKEKIGDHGDVEEIMDDDTEKIRDDVKEKIGDHGDVEEIMDDDTEKIRDDTKETKGDHGDVEEIKDDHVETKRDDHLEELKDDDSEKIRDGSDDREDDDVETAKGNDVEEIEDDDVEEIKDDNAERIKGDNEVKAVKDDDVEEIKDDDVEEIKDDDVEEIKDDDVEEIKDDDVEKMKDDDHVSEEKEESAKGEVPEIRETVEEIKGNDNQQPAEEDKMIVKDDDIEEVKDDSDDDVQIPGEKEDAESNNDVEEVVEMTDDVTGKQDEMEVPDGVDEKHDKVEEKLAQPMETHVEADSTQLETSKMQEQSEDTRDKSIESTMPETHVQSIETQKEVQAEESVLEETAVETQETQMEVEHTEPIEKIDDKEITTIEESRESECEIIETDNSVTENKMPEIESAPTEIDREEIAEPDVEMGRVPEDKNKNHTNEETEDGKEVTESESTSLGIDSLSIDPTNTSEETAKDQSAEQPSSTSETKPDDENAGGSNESEKAIESLSQNDPSSSVPGVDSQGKSTDVVVKSNNFTHKKTGRGKRKGKKPVPKTVPVRSNNIDQANDESESGSNPVFEHVDTENEKTANDKSNEPTLPDNQPQEDPIASDDSAPTPMEDDSEELEQPADEQTDVEQGASEEMCIIPDTERVISQAEREAAAGMVPLCDPTESGAFASDPSPDGITGESSVEKKKSANTETYLVSLCTDENVNACMQCCLPRKSKYSVFHNKLTSYVCDDGCLNNFKRRRGDKVVMNAEGDLRVKKLTSGANNDNMVAKAKFRRKCSECHKKIVSNDSVLSWETMEFCNESCLSKYQKKVASNCSNCQVAVRNNCLGKYCVRFGYDIRQFCSSICLEEYKKGLKVCSYCQKDMSSGGGDGFLAPVGDKGQFKDFCTQACMEKYDVMSNNRRQIRKPGSTCSVCLNEKPITIEFEHNKKINLFCGEPCFVAFKFVNNITPAKCNMCKKYFDNKVLEENSMFYDNSLHSFCSKSCQNIYIIGHRKIVPCSWCKVKKYNFDMIKRMSVTTGSSLLMCSLNCLSLYQVSINAVQSKKTKCDHCQKTLQPLYHLTMSDASMRNFCSYPCVMAFQNQFPKTPITLNEPEESSTPVPTGGPKRSKRTAIISKQKEPAPAEVPTIPVISSVQSLATTNGPTTGPTIRTRSKPKTVPPVKAAPPIIKTQIKQHFIIKQIPIPPQRNIGTLCKVNTESKGIICKPTTCNKEVQTDEIKDKTAIIPIPVPIYVPAPMWMYSMPYPVPFPFPLPVPVPIFIPTTRNSATGIMKEIKKIQVKIPTDPFEAELLMMAEIVAGDKKEEHTDSESEEEDAAPPPEETTFSPEPVDASNTFGDDMLQMALKMATELDEPAVDLEGALTANTITASQGPEPAAVEEPPEEPQPPIHHIMERPTVRGRKRPGRPPKTGGTGSKRGRRASSQMEIPIMAPPQPPPPPEPVEKPDANMCLKYTFGVNAWKQWVTTKNAELEKSSRRVKLFKPEILQLTADELNYSLCLFVKEVRKPNGQEYAPDTIYYLCLGIQQYLFENARIDNIFCDPYYEKFTDCLDEVAKKFSVLYNDSHYIVTRVEEEHLWESKQLGAHSPHVLLSTLMFFNTKHFNLTTVDEHMQLSFSHIMKHWKRSTHGQPGTAKVAGSRNVLLRFYPPQTSSAESSQRKKKVYEQQENEDNPLRCPVKLYEFYLSKCPESVKTRNDVFYLLPERSCVPDSPVWYSTMPLPRPALEKMLHRVKMVKEINVALLTS